MGELPAFEGDAFEGGPPITESGGGDFFSQELGTLLRMRYNTESYGQDRRGNLDIGTMQVANFQDAITFFDGQVTLSDVNGVGYNLGVGFRWLGWSPFPLEPERITGFNFWADGSSTEAGSFFPQVGVGFESLGDMWDLRVNGYIPLGQESQIGEFSPTGAITFDENFLVQEAIADRNTSFNVAEAEIARRIMPDRDAWAFVGPYVLGNDDQDAAGYRVGMRGYAYPDLLLQIAVTDDDIFKTNAAFSVTWFVGRTRNNFQPACGLPDRMREPVMRNDYVALQRTTEVGGEALTNTDGEAFRFVHVNANAPAGGDGTFENPLNDVGEVFPNSQESDIVLLYSNGTFASQNTLVLQDNQRLLGEGNGEFFTINTQQQGVVVIPETSPGARDGMRPIIMDALGLGAVQLADANEVANFNINGSAGDGIFSPATGAGNPNIHDLNISNTTDDGIQFTPLTRTDADNPLLKTVAGNVTIDDVVFDNVGGNDIDIDSETSENINDPNVTLQEVISITDVTTTDGNNFSLNLSNTHSGAGRSTTIARFTYDGGTTGGGMRLSNYNGTLNMSASTFTNGSDLLAGVQIGGVSDGAITLTDTVDFDSVEGTVIDVGPLGADVFNGTFTVNGDITNHDSGRLVSIQGLGNSTAAVTLAGDMTDVEDMGSTGILIKDNDDGTILFTGDLIVDTTGDNRTGIELDTNDSTDISFNGLVDVTTNGQDSNAFDAHDGGTLTVLGTTNTLTSTGGTGLRIVDMTISTAAVKFAEINVSAGVGPVTTPDNGIFLQDNTGGAIDLGILTDPVGDSGTISGTSLAAVVIDNSENVTISGMIINATAGQTGVEITKNTTGTQITNLNNLDVNDGLTGIDVIGSGTGTLNMTVNDTTIDMPTGTGLSFNNIDDGTIGINNLDVDGVGVTSTAGVSIVNSDATFTFDADSSIQGVDGVDFNVNGGEVAITMGGDITNTVGRSIAVQNITGGNLSFTTTSAVNDDGVGILVNANTGGTIEFEGSYDLDTTVNDAVTITNNTGATINFTPLSAAGSFDIDTTTGSGFVATGGGTLTVAGTGNTITGSALAAGKFGLQIENMTIGAGAVAFESVNTTGGSSGIRLVDNLTGTISVGDTGAAVGLGGTITGTADNGVHVQNSNVTLNGVTVTNAGGVGDDAVLIQHSNATNMTAALNNLTINTTRTGLHIDGTGGTNTFNVNSTSGTITAAESDIEVEGQLSTVNLTQNITSTAGRSIHVHNVTAGTMTHTGTVTDTGGTGVLIADNTGGNINLLGDYNLNTAGNDAVTITNNTGATMQLTNLDIDTTAGDGFVATGGGTLTVSGTTNTINTTTGVGLDIEDMTIGAGGANFQSVTVTGGTTNGIVLDNLTGGQVQIGTVGGATNSGGSLTTAMDAIVLTNVENVDLRHIRIVDVTGAGGDGIAITHNNTGTTAMDVTIDDLNLDAATARGINLVADNDASTFAMRLTNSDIDNADVLMDVTGAGQFGLLVDSTDITTDPGIAGRAFDLQFHDGATDGDVTIRNGSSFSASDGEGLFIDSFDATPKDIKLLVEDSTFTDTLGTEIAADIRNRGTSLMQVTIQGNTFASAGAARDLSVASSGTAASQIRLNLGGDITSPADFNSAVGQGTMLVSQAGTSIYGIFDLNATTVTDTRNNQPVDTNGGVFQNLVVPPTLPTVP